MPISWLNSMSVGNDLVDTDHKNLIQIINKFEEALENEVDSEKIASILHELDNYTVEHFKREELLMKKVNYPHYYKHFREHHNLVSQLTALKSEIILNIKKSGAMETSDALVNLLRHWLIDHVFNEDLLLKPYLNKYPSNYS